MVLTKAMAKSLSILSVAERLGMELKRTGTYGYEWEEHDSFVIDTRSNTFYWNSRSEFGDVIQLVQTVKGVSYKEAMHFLETGEFPEVDIKALEAKSEPFNYTLGKYEHPDFALAKTYLRDERGLSEETIDFFLNQGSMAEATRKKGDYLEPVIVFKYKDHTSFLAGASLQGIVENLVQYPERGRLKQIMKNSDGLLGFSVDVGTPNRLVFAESPIDLMSYYELHKDTLQNVRLVAMDGVKEGIISRRFMELYAEMNGKEYKADKTSSKALEAVVRTTDFFKEDNHQNMITLAVDNDPAGHNFITNFLKKEIPVQIDIPPILYRNQDKADWNDYLSRPVTPGTNLSHIYSFDGEEYHYQGYYPEELADFKQKELATDERQVLISKEVLTKKELKSRFDNLPISPEKKVQEVQEAGAEYHVSKAQGVTESEEKKLDNSRLGQARRKLDRLNNEFSEATNAVYRHFAMTNGQPMNDKRNGASFFRKADQLENRVFNKLHEIKEQEERVERLEAREERKAAGLNRSGNGLEMSVQNIPRIREELEKAKRGESFYTNQTLKRYREELTRLERISEQMAKTAIQPGTQALIDEGVVNQWAKQPNLYFVKGLRRVAVELSEEGIFKESAKYRPQTPEEREKLNQILEVQLTNAKLNNDVKADNEEELSEIIQEATNSSLGTIPGKISEEPSSQLSEQGVLFENLVDVTSNQEQLTEPQLQVVFDFTENKKLSRQYSSGDIIPYKDFISKLYEENEWQMIGFKLGYDKTYFALADEKGNRLTNNFRYDIGTEKQDLSEQLAQNLPTPYLELAQKADHDYHAQVSYETFKSNLKNLTQAVQSQIQAGVLSVTLSDEAYFYTLVNYTGWSHPMQQLKPEALEKLKEHRPFLESINDTNIERFKEKGTPEQNQMYELLKGIQKELGRSNTSTVFSEEVAISAYNLNRRLNSLTAENWGQSYSDPLGNLGQDTWKILSYPANEIETYNHDYDFQLVSYHLMEYLNGKTGTVEISPETYETILKQLREEAVIIMPEVSEEATISIEKSSKQNKKVSSNKLDDSNQKAPEEIQERKKVETNLGDFPEESQVAAPLPEANESRPLNDLSPSQTRSQPLLHFSINGDRKSIHKDNYHPVSDKDLRKLNRYTPHLQNAAAWYLENIADSQVTYFYQEGANTNSVTISYNKESFMHLTGIFPYKEGQTAEQTLSDFAAGNGEFDNILIANRGAAFDKLKVLPELPVIVDSESFYFGDLSDVEKFHTLNLDKAIRSSDQDVLLAFRTVDGATFPASLMRLRQGLNLQLDQSNQEKIILGIYRERNGKIEQLSINEDYIKDGGRELQSIMENGLFEEDISKEEPPFPNRSDYDSYLDAVIEYKQEEGRRNGIFVDPNESLVDAARRLGIKLKDDLVEQEEVSKIDSGQTLQETVDFKEELPMAEPFTDAQKEHIREFFKTRISDVKKDYIYLNSGREDTAYYLDGYLFAHQYAELFPLSPDQQVDALMSRLVSEDGQKFDYVEEGFTIDRIDQDFLKDKFGYNPDTPIEEYRLSEKNIDRIQAKEEEAFLQSIDRENFVKVLDLVKENDVWTVFQLKEELGLEVDTSQVYDFIDRYLDPNHDLSYGFSNDLFSNLQTDTLLKKAEEKGLYLNQEKRSTIDQNGDAEYRKQEITEYKLEPHWESANEITANSFEELKMKFLEQMDRHIELEKEFTASNLEFQKDRHSIAMGVWSDKQILKYMRDDSSDFEVNGFRIESSWDDNPYDLLDSISEDGKIFDKMTYHEIQKKMEEYQQVQNEEIHQHNHNRKDEMDRDLDGLPDRVEEAGTTLLDSPDSDGDGISDYDELTQGTDPNNVNSNIYRTAEKELNDAEKQTEMIEVQEEVEDKKTRSKNNSAKVNSSNKQKETSEEVEEGSSKMVSELIVAGDIAGLNQHLKKGVKQYLNSEHYKHYLDKMSQLNNYSSRNIQLILAQNPNAKYVTSLNKWNKEFGRYINKGEKALKIIAPNIHLKKDSEGNPMLDKEGKPVTYMTFQVKSVFDVSQTKGKELPKALQPVKENLSDLDYANLYRSLKTIADNNHVQVRFEQLENGRRGRYNPKNNEIVIHKDMGKAQIIKTFLHETAHSELHHSHHQQTENLTYSNAELQAESVAYVVASYYGMDTAEHSFGYLAKWTDDKKALSDLEAQLDIVQQEAKSLIQRMDKELEKLKVIQVKQDKNRFADKLSHYQSKTEKSIQERQTKEEKDSKKLKGISK
ncbi:PBECR4 domain-containing protein [Streptococcus anginosus]|uniref:PBECR4 domain-containing protein n=1 Tax=Streptococcus anginosus TaxID=1328 RepID=UPI0003908937|nr:PBECR4 domain-containing protein [Streptococcus anginosus]AGU83840.1 putative conjugative transposon membrane protein [Streptococcus anginosus C238]MDP1384413.1 LPD25 domain-containing protein [Streptococcus anginosus]